MARFGWWRPCLLLAAGFILGGGPLHPGGTMAEMLAHLDWVLSHLLIFPMVMLLALWMALAAFWPLRGELRQGALEPAAAG
jgi:hypothetical protein